MQEAQPIQFPTSESDHDEPEKDRKATASSLEPSNTVHARVGDTVLRAARDGVRHGTRPEDIIREIAAEHHVRLNLSELRLLLASRTRVHTGPRGLS